jgi:hypothetical protein
MNLNPAILRRDFLKLASAAAAGAAHNAVAATGPRVAIVLDGSDPMVSRVPVRWAAEKLQRALAASGAVAEIVDSPSHAGHGSFLVMVARESSAMAQALPRAGTPLIAAESLRLTPARVAGNAATWVGAIDERGFVYGLLELAERVQFGGGVAALHLTAAVEEKPANAIRSVARAFCSEIEDKAWFYDKELWRSYLDMLATSRYNRFNFALGFGYDFPRGVTGDYFHFPYPYLVDVPGYSVHVVPLSDAERERNLDMLRFIVAETAARGLQFQLGLWTHAYEWVDSPHADHHIEGLTAQTHAPYCRDALAMLLKLCPGITGVTMRVHGESGIPEGSYPFWQTLFDAIAKCGRTIEIDMHAKGINQIMIDMAVGTGMPVKVSPKYSAEHQSLGYHQADIRELEIPRPNRMETGVFSVSNGERRFTRYGYADLFTADRRFDVLFRLWPGTQRHLLSADPAMAAAYGRTSHFCGASGLEICEPLTFKGREGSGQPGGRCAYADVSLTPKQGDWRKFEYSYRLWGRLLYNPDADAETWRRFLREDFGAGAVAVEYALANAGRILPLLTSAHLASASNHSLWYEMYDNMPIVPGGERSSYSDTPAPRVFATVSALDPQLFSTIAEHTAALLEASPNAKYSPVEVAQWMSDLASASNRAIALAKRSARSTSPSFRRVEEDVFIQVGLGRFFAAKLRSGMLFEIYLQTHDAEAGRLALAEYRKARDAWKMMAERAATVYRADVAYGDIPMRRGHWTARLPAIDRDIAAMEASLKREAPASASVNAETLARARNAVTARPQRIGISCEHSSPSNFRPGEALALSLKIADAQATTKSASIKLFYRHVNHGERWHSMSMEQNGGLFSATVPASYTQSKFPLQYYFELHRADTAWLYPAFNATLSNQPYYVVARA